MLDLKNINVILAHRHILKNISCTVNEGDFIVIVGTNGSGKSTLFDTISGKIKPHSGRIMLNGSDITTLSELQRSQFVTRIFQKIHLNSVGSFTVMQNLAFALYNRRYARLISGLDAMPREKAKDILTSLGMHEEILDKRMNQLSGGQQQLIAFAMATQLAPQILLMDEPTAALDPQAATTLLKYVATFVKEHKITTLLVTHDPLIALAMGNKVWILENGTIAQEFSGDHKKSLHPGDLIGQIDYAQLRNCNPIS